ncbi:MAG: ABC transporter ATP-binding protein, partial [Candidatus Bipolaricaulota bacterium]|nr:ABC transporter ATP-binding protein [Candidatus Bipolaricaulota bacterium]
VLPKNVHTYTGSVRLDGRELLAFSDEEFRRQIRWRKISMAFQGAMNVLNPVLKVGYQIAEPLLQDGQIPKEKAFARVREILQLVGLSPETAERFPHELSGGMKQRVVLATALVFNPSLVILDEPTSALDVSVQAQIMNLLKKLKSELGLTFIFITHDIALASDLCDRLGIAYAGQLVEEGPIEEILQRPTHPYTQGLLESMPLLHSDKSPSFIPGAPPGLIDPPKGCRFAPRCPYVFERCEQPPPLCVTPHGSRALCWLLAEPAPLSLKREREQG